MKLLKSSPTGEVYRDTDQVLKVKEPTSARWEAHVLELLKGVHGVPQNRGHTGMIGLPGDKRLVAMDFLPGVPLSEVVPPVDPCVILGQLYTILSQVYMRGVCHSRVTPENILCTPEGGVSLIGFSKALLFQSPVMDLMGLSPDFTGIIPGALTLSGPAHDGIEGGYNKMVEFFSGVRA